MTVHDFKLYDEVRIKRGNYKGEVAVIDMFASTYVRVRVRKTSYSTGFLKWYSRSSVEKLA